MFQIKKPFLAGDTRFILEKSNPQLFLLFGHEACRMNDLVQEEVQNVALHPGGCVLDLVGN